MVGYVDTAVSIFESAAVAELTVAISAPPQGFLIETSFLLLVNTIDGTAPGLSSCLAFDVHTHCDMMCGRIKVPLFTVFIIQSQRVKSQALYHSVYSYPGHETLCIYTYTHRNTRRS